MPGPPPSLLAVVAGLATALLLVACEPVEEAVTNDEAPEAAGDAVVRDDLEGILDTTDVPAQEWDEDARVVDLSVRLVDDTPRAARVTYLAPDADRLLVIDVGEDGLEEEQPTFETLGFEPVPASAVGDVAPVPEGLVEPTEVADDAAEAIEECGLDGIREVLYATGAPAAWDGSQWTSAPEWTVTVLDEDGAGVVLDAAGEPTAEPCITVP